MRTKPCVPPQHVQHVPEPIRTLPTFPYNEDRTEKWCFKCNAFKVIGEFSTRLGRLTGKCKQCHVLPAEEKRARNVKQNDKGFSLDQYDAMFEAQGGVCAICKRPERILHHGGKPKPLAVDHCHKTNRVRALLCTECNSALGQMHEDPERIRALLAYVEQWQGT